MGKPKRVRLCVTAWSLLYSAMLSASTSGAIKGKIVDVNGGAVAGATVIVVEQRTNGRRIAVSDEDGLYVVQLLSPGVYRVTVEAGALEGTAPERINLNVDQVQRVDVTLRLRAVNQDVVVTASVSPVDTDTSNMGQVVDEALSSTLPLNERNFLAFALLAAGVHPSADGSENSSAGIAISVNGAREQSNNFLLHGTDNNDPTINHYFARPSLDAVQEFKVQTSTSSAEFGRGGGAQINVVLKSGTNEYHGSAFGFLRNRHFDAKNFFDPPDCGPVSVPHTCGGIPVLDRNQVGATLGGPIKRNRAFFFVSYEGLRLHQAITLRATVPSQEQRALALAAVPPEQRNAAGLAVLNLLPAANVGPNYATSNNFVSAPIISENDDNFVAKLDYQPGGRDTVSGHYALSGIHRFNPFDPLFSFTNLPGYGSYILNRGHNLGMTWVRVVNSDTANAFGLGFNRTAGPLWQQSSGVSRSQQLGFPDVFTTPVDLGFPEVAIARFDGIGEAFNLPQARAANTFQVQDNLTFRPGFQEGRHELRIGGDIRRVQMNRYLDLFARGRWAFLGGFSGNPLVDLLRGTPDFALAAQGDTHLAGRMTLIALYLQDNIHFGTKVVVNAGLRWEYNSPLVDIRNRMSFPDLNPASGNCSPVPNCLFIVAGTNGFPRGIYRPDLNNFAPRVGFAWKPFATDRFVVRSAYGISYDLQPLDVNLFPRLNPPFFQVLFFPNLGTSTIQNILSQPVFQTPPIVRTVDPAFRSAYVQQWYTGFQYELLRHLQVEVAYVGSRGIKLPIRRDINQIQATRLAPFPQFGPIDTFLSAGSSNYNAFEVRSERRISRTLILLATYTWSKSIDDASSLFGTATEPGIAQDSANPQRERGLSDNDVRHRFVWSYVLRLPFGVGERWANHGGISKVLQSWQLSGIITLQSGLPFTINRGIDQSQSGTTSLGVFADRPNQVSDPFQAGPVMANPDPRCHSTISQGGLAADAVHSANTWFNPCAFADAGIGHFGTADRNSVIAPVLQQIDLSISKETRLGKEPQTLQVRVDFFNIFNHPNFDTPNRNFDSATFAALISANAYHTRPPRQIQIGLRYSF
jgi:hypothetical protein